jgi:hypothetical protein
MKKELLKAWVKLPEKEQRTVSKRTGVDVSRINGYFANINELRTDSLELLVSSLGFILTVKTK